MVTHAPAVDQKSDKKACACGGRGSCSCDHAKPDIHRFATGPYRAPTALASAVLARPGSPLPAASRARFERSFGADLSGVRVHTDEMAARAANDLNADAWTSGHHVVLAAGRYAPGTAPGDRLLAHELTHVIQQRTSQPMAQFGGDNPASEAQAERAADRFASGAQVGHVPVAAPGIARQARGGGVTRVEINGRDRQMTFNGPNAHTWRLTSCDLSDGDYTATVEKSRDADGHPVVRFRIRNAPEGIRFQFEYRVEGRELNPYDAVQQGHSVQIHAVSSSSTALTPTRDASGNEGQTTFHVAVIDAAAFEQSTGTAASALPDGQIVDGSSFRFGAAVPGAGMGALRAPYPFPSNTTGVLWTGQHMSDLAVVNGVPTVRGFRADFATHAQSAAERSWFGRRLGLFGGPGGDATYSLNAGAPGSYAEDYWYLYSPGARLVHRGALDPSAAEAGRDTINAGIGRYNQEYRFSPPPPGNNPAFNRLSGGNPNYACRPGQNCINLPIEEHTAMLGGRRMTINPDNPVDIATGNTVATNEPFEFRTPEGRAYSGPGYARNADTWAAAEGDLTRQGLTSTPTFRGMAVRGVLKAGGAVLLIYGVYSTATRIADAPDDERFVVASEEGGSWLGGWVGSVIGSAVSGAVICSETGPGAVLCSGGFAIAGGITGSVVGAGAARDAAQGAQNIGQLLRNPAALNEAAVQMFGTDEQRRQFYEDRQFLEDAGF